MERKKAAGYIRTVTDDRNNIDEQKRAIEKAIFELEYDLVDIHFDAGKGNSLEREGIRRLLDTVRKKDVDMVFVYSSDVLSTDGNDILELMEALSYQNVRIYSVSEKRVLNIPLDTLNNLSTKIFNTLNEMEQNGVNLKDNYGSDVKDPISKLQVGIIDAYLRIQNEHHRI